MSEIIEPNSIRADTPDWQEGYGQGLLQERLHVIKLVDEVMEAYKELLLNSPESKIIQAQINAVKFTKSWVQSGGLTDTDGERACYPW